MSYVELHCLTNFSFLRGASHPDELGGAGESAADGSPRERPEEWALEVALEKEAGFH